LSLRDDRDGCLAFLADAGSRSHSTCSSKSFSTLDAENLRGVEFIPDAGTGGSFTSKSTNSESANPGGCPNPMEGLPSSRGSPDELVTRGDLSGVRWDVRRTLGLSNGGLISSSRLLDGDVKLPIGSGGKVKPPPLGVRASIKLLIHGTADSVSAGVDVVETELKFSREIWSDFMKLEPALTWRSAGKLCAPEIPEDVREIPAADADDDSGDFFGDMLGVLGFAASENDEMVLSVNGDDDIGGLFAMFVSNDDLRSILERASVEVISDASSTPDSPR